MRKAWFHAMASLASIAALGMIVGGPLRADAQTQVTVETAGGRLGSVGYVLMNATAELINKESSWVRAIFTESTGGTENLRTVAESSEKRKSYVYYADIFTIRQAAVGDSPFHKPYKSNKIIARMVENITGFVTLDPNLKKVEDLVGKKVAVGPKGISVYWHNYRILHEGYGIWDKIKPEFLGFSQSKDALIDGLIDVASQGSVVLEAGEAPDRPRVAAPIPAARELLERKRKQLHVVDIEKQAIDRAREKSGYPLFWMAQPPGTWGSNQPVAAGGDAYVMTWNCDAEMRDDVVYEITRIIYENAEKFKDYHIAGKGISRKNMSQVLGATEEDFHPGAIKFYKEKGIEIGVPAGK